MITFCVFALFCLVVSTFSFLKIYFTLRHRQSQVVSQSEREHRQMSTRANVFKYKRTVALSVWIYLILTLCYLPYVVVQIVRALYGDSISIVIAEGVTTSMMYHNSTINPLIYCWSMREVRQTVKSTIRKFCCLCCQFYGQIGASDLDNRGKNASHLQPAWQEYRQMRQMLYGSIYVLMQKVEQ